MNVNTAPIKLFARNSPLYIAIICKSIAPKLNSVKI